MTLKTLQKRADQVRQTTGGGRMIFMICHEPGRKLASVREFTSREMAQAYIDLNHSEGGFHVCGSATGDLVVNL